MAPPRIPVADRFWGKVGIKGPDDCWEWKGNRYTFGHGQIRVNGSPTTAHRVAYELHYGVPILNGLHCLHACDNPSCVNPGHLWLGTNADNVADMCDKGRHRNSVKTECPQGHPYDEANTYTDKKGRRQCLTCNRARNAAWRAARKAS